MQNNTEAACRTSDIGHTSLIVFHGIGAPRQLTTLSNFLEEYSEVTEADDFKTMGFPRAFKSLIEESNDGTTRSFIQFKIIKNVDGNDEQTKIIRSYEGYWGNDRAKHISLALFAGILLKIFITAIKIRYSSWRRFPLYRLRTLHTTRDSALSKNVTEKLEKLYRRFDHLESRKEFPEGTFAQFLKMIDQNKYKKIYGDLSDAAKIWRRSENKRLHEIFFNMFIALAILIPAIAAALFIAPAIYTTANEPDIAKKAAWASLIILSLLGISALAVWRPIKQRLSDIYYWTTSDERSFAFSVRERRLALAEDLIWKVVSNERCNDCVIVGHSLGSAIVIEALSRVAARAKAMDLTLEETEQRHKRIRKIKTVFLLGSPVDALFSLFQEDLGSSRRYRKWREETRPSINNAIFDDIKGSKGAQLINFWSRFDPISAEIHSLQSPSGSSRNTIINCESIPSGIPRPGASHSGYYRDKGVMKPIHEAITQGIVDEQKIDCSVPIVSNTRAMKGWWWASLIFCVVLFLGAIFKKAMLVLLGFILMQICMLVYLSIYAKAVKEKRQNARNMMS